MGIHVPLLGAGGVSANLVLVPDSARFSFCGFKTSVTVLLSVNELQLKPVVEEGLAGSAGSNHSKFRRSCTASASRISSERRSANARLQFRERKGSVSSVLTYWAMFGRWPGQQGRVIGLNSHQLRDKTVRLFCIWHTAANTPERVTSSAR